MFSLGHLSDLHATPVRVERVSQLLNKRLLGWLSWRVKRRHSHRPAVLEALIDDLRSEAPDHVVVTGDLTNVALEPEFVAARAWLERLGDASRISVVPGNHDAYVRVAPEASWRHWDPFMLSDADRDPGGGFPMLRVRGPVALIGVCSATPTLPFLATGRVGAAQLERLERRLAELADTPLFRVVLIHHPLVNGPVVSPRRALVDREALTGVLRRAGAELVLHGHAHRTLIDQVPGPRGPIPVIGARSSSDVGHRPEKRAQYHVYRIERGEGAERFRVTLRIRGYDPATGRFAHEEERSL